MVFTLLVVSLILFMIGRAAERHRLRALEPSEPGRTGRVALAGSARADVPQTAPVTGTACAYWEAEAWDTRPFHNRFAVHADRAATSLLWLEEADGRRTPVLLYGAQWSWDPRAQVSVDATLLGQRAWTFVQRCGLDPKALPYRARERRIDDGAPLHVIGVLEPVGEMLPRLSDIAAGNRAHALAEMDRAKRPPGSVPQSAADCAAALQRRLGPHELVLWCASSGLFITPGDRSGLERRLRAFALACRIGAGVSFASALAMFLLAVAAW